MTQTGVLQKALDGRRISDEEARSLSGYDDLQNLVVGLGAGMLLVVLFCLVEIVRTSDT